jgi:hypothetical protein
MKLWAPQNAKNVLNRWATGLGSMNLVPCSKCHGAVKATRTGRHTSDPRHGAYVRLGSPCPVSGIYSCSRQGHRGWSHTIKQSLGPNSRHSNLQLSQTHSNMFKLVSVLVFSYVSVGVILFFLIDTCLLLLSNRKARNAPANLKLSMFSGTCTEWKKNKK